MNRRGFLGAILATGCAPAIVRAENLMKIVVPSPVIWDLTEEYERFVLYGGARGGGMSDLTFTQIVMETFKKHRGELIRNTTEHNALLRRLTK